MNQKRSHLAAIAFYIYFVSTGFCAVPYFNWRYAQEHGFASWVFFGEVVATVKAAIWPYYAVAALTSSSADSSVDTDFANSRHASHKALSIISQFDGVMNLPPKEASDVVQLLEASVTEADLVKDSYLQSVHPDFLYRFRNGYTASLRDLADGIRTGDSAKMMSASAAYNSFSDWVSAHAKEVKFK